MPIKQEKIKQEKIKQEKAVAKTKKSGTKQEKSDWNDLVSIKTEQDVYHTAKTFISETRDIRGDSTLERYEVGLLMAAMLYILAETPPEEHTVLQLYKFLSVPVGDLDTVIRSIYPSASIYTSFANLWQKDRSKVMASVGMRLKFYILKHAKNTAIIKRTAKRDASEQELNGKMDGWNDFQVGNNG